MNTNLQSSYTPDYSGIIAIKIGSNVLTRDDGTLDITRLSHIADQVAELNRRGFKIILISSGAVASGRSELRHHLDSPENSLDPVSRRQLFSAVGQAKLINRYFDLFREHNIPCGQVLTTKESFSTRRQYLNQQHCISVMLDAGVIPIVNENDTVSVTELMFTDNDELSGLIATMMKASRLIILSNIDGIFTGDPALPGAELIPVIEPGTDLSNFIADSKSSLGRGGMATKNRIAGRVAAEGIAVTIANGTRSNILLDLIDRPESTPSTTFIPAPVSPSAVKNWIAASASFAKGKIIVNNAAAEAIAGPTAVSLLPIGVTAIEGDFEKGDIVTVVNQSGKTIAIGRAAVSATAAAASIGRRGERHIIHADYLYIES